MLHIEHCFEESHWSPCLLCTCLSTFRQSDFNENTHMHKVKPMVACAAEYLWGKATFTKMLGPVFCVLPETIMKFQKAYHYAPSPFGLQYQLFIWPALIRTQLISVIML